MTPSRPRLPCLSILVTPCRGEKPSNRATLSPPTPAGDVPSAVTQTRNQAGTSGRGASCRYKQYDPPARLRTSLEVILHSQAGLVHGPAELEDREAEAASVQPRRDRSAREDAQAF
jgi:hypothetical protein